MNNSSNPLSLRELYRTLRQHWLADATDEEIELLVGSLEQRVMKEESAGLPEGVRLFSERGRSGS